MSKSEHELLTELRAILTNQRYNPTVIRNHCTYAQEFLEYLQHRGICVTDVTRRRLSDIWITRSRYSGNVVAGIPASAGTQFHDLQFTRCYGLGRVSGHPLKKQHAPLMRCGLRSATNTKPGFARSVALPRPASTRSCGKRATSLSGNSTGAAAMASRQ